VNELIKVNDTSERPTVSGRELHEFLEVATRYNDWFDRMADYGFTDGVDFEAITQKRVTAQGNETTLTDHQLTIDMAKEIAMIQRTEKGKQARQYFIEVERQWNNPEAVIRRGYELAKRRADEAWQKFLNSESVNRLLIQENKVLAGEVLEWADRKSIEAIVKKIGGNIGYSEAWHEYKKELLYKHGININSRITAKTNATGKKTIKTLDMIRDDELSRCIGTAAALARHFGVTVTEILDKKTQKGELANV
jgi:anti-repressor protein